MFHQQFICLITVNVSYIACESSLFKIAVEVSGKVSNLEKLNEVMWSTDDAFKKIICCGHIYY